MSQEISSKTMSRSMPPTTRCCAVQVAKAKRSLGKRGKVTPFLFTMLKYTRRRMKSFFYLISLNNLVDLWVNRQPSEKCSRSLDVKALPGVKSGPLNRNWRRMAIIVTYVITLNCQSGAAVESQRSGHKSCLRLHPGLIRLCRTRTPTTNTPFTAP